MKDSRILIAENHELMPLVASALANYQVIQATSVLDAMDLIAKGNIDLFVISLHFDDSRSLELFAYVRSIEKCRGTPIILLRTQLILLEELLRQTANTLKRTNLISEYLECDHTSEVPATLNACVENFLPS
jgi:CheY-like chemotaxis protein